MTERSGPLECFRLDSKVAVVTGSSRGIGRAIVLGLAGAGARVVVNGRNPEGVAAVAKEIHDQGGTALAIPADVSRAEEVERLFTQVTESWGGVDILINNAGISPIYRRAEEIQEVEWDLILNTNLKSAFLCAQAAGRIMRAQGGGAIVNMSSVGGSVALPRLLAYCVAKGGIEQLTRVLAVEWAQYKIRVNAIAPAYVETDMARAVLDHPRWGQQVVQHTPLGRTAKAEEMVGAALYLVSDASSFVTGHILTVDGGWTAW